ncbi:MAG: tetratricopeptide (TPR) repeat protein [Planctomycetota bacterium]|jgi:tetratricopeptide (TPR) repeat protein
MDDYYDLGSYSRHVSTESADAQRWFDRGLIWTYGYHHEEAIECFRKSLEFDPHCVMSHWGIAYASGPNYNKKWVDFDDDEKQSCLADAHHAVAAATAHIDNASDLEAGMLGALAHRYPEGDSIDDFGPCNNAFADVMRKVYQQFSDDMDVCTIFAEALMNRTPWQLWDLPSGKPAEGADTLEAIEVLESAFTRLAKKGANQHPGLLHMYIHLMEMSPTPEKALNVGNRLTGLVPDAGHLQHMATHIDVLCGDYQNVVTRNHNAIQVDKKYLQRGGALNFYSLYRCHNYHFKIYGAMFLGQQQVAMDTANELESTLPREVLEPMADWIEPFFPMKQHVLIRFGRWDEIKQQSLPDDAELYAMTHALMHYAKTVAHAATGDIAAAEAARDDFRAAKAAMPETRYLFNNSCIDILGVAEAMLEGELSYRKGDFDAAFDQLRRSVELDDTLPYDEPWGWMQPTRHALGALLLEQERIEEAAAVYRADLGFDGTLARPCQHPNNVWSLHGLHECLQKLGHNEEAGILKPQLDIALARADVTINYSCFCRGM